MKNKLTQEQKADLTELLSITWNGRQDMVDYCLKSHVYIQLDDGRFVSVTKAKPEIDKDLWYDDETKGPDASIFENFRQYNLSNAPKHFVPVLRDFGHEKKLALYPCYSGDKANGRLLSVGYAMDGDASRLGAIEYLTGKDVEKFNKVIDGVRADYEKRLATYWKRYSSKVHARGYWANR